MNLIAKKFYHLGENSECFGNDHFFTVLKSFHSRNFKLNDLYNIIYGFNEKTGAMPDDIGLSLSDSTPTEVRSFLACMLQHVPSFASCKTDDDAFATIVSRYAQFGGEIDAVVNDLVSEYKHNVSSVDVSSVSDLTPE